MNYRVSPSDLTFAFHECKRCFYDKVHSHLSRPSVPMAKIFGSIDRAMKFALNQEENLKRCPAFVGAKPTNRTDYVTSQPMKFGNVGLVIHGRYDTLLELPDGGYLLIDGKTIEINQENVEKYSDQLHCYAFALENPQRGRPYNPVKRLGLFMFAPEVLTIGENDDGQFRGKLKFQEVPRNDSAFLNRMEKVAAALADARPEPADGCKFCGYRQSAVKELEVAQQNERFWAAARIAEKQAFKQPLTTMIPITGSSCLLSAGWQDGLALQFRNGNAVYFYPDAPQSVYDRLMAAESKGRFVNDCVVGRFVTERLS